MVETLENWERPKHQTKRSGRQHPSCSS
jgi:hypothetical protein